MGQEEYWNHTMSTLAVGVHQDGEETHRDDINNDNKHTINNISNSLLYQPHTPRKIADRIIHFNATIEFMLFKLMNQRSSDVTDHSQRLTVLRSSPADFYPASYIRRIPLKR